MKHILWLTSWYPNHYHPSNGDFIRRHAQALALYAKVHVLFVTPATGDDVPYMEEANNAEGNLTEQVIYYKANEGSFWGKVQSRLRYMRLAKHFVKQYIQQHGMPDYVHAHVPIRAGLIALWIKRKYKINYALTEHYGIYNNEVDDAFVKRSAFFRRSVRDIIRNAEPFLPVSDKIAQDIKHIVLKKDYTVIPNVVNTDFFNHTARTVNDKFRFVHVSNMVPLKNVEGIISAVEQLAAKRTDFNITLIGHNTTELVELARSKNLLGSFITFTGEVAYTKVAEAVKQADAFVLFSNTENNPCVILEALCSGVPVVASRVGGIPESVNPTNGLLVDARNVAQLAEAMEAMIANRQSYNHAQISAEASQLYSYPVIGQQILNSYGFTA